MAFDLSKLQLNSGFSMAASGFPGIFTYISDTDNLAAISTDGYFDSNFYLKPIG